MPGVWSTGAVIGFFLSSAIGQLPMVHFASERQISSSATPSYRLFPLIHFADFNNCPVTAPLKEGNNRIVVLPFIPEKKSAPPEWITRELAASLVWRLGCIQGIDIKDSGKLKSDRKITAGDAAAIARRIKARAAVMGSCSLKKSTLSLTFGIVGQEGVELGKPISIDGDFTKIGELEGRMAVRVASALGLNLSDVQKDALRRVPTVSNPAYEAYCKGLQAPDGSHLKIQCFQKAIEADPVFAEAHYLLGNAYLGIGMTYQYVEWFDMALDEYRKAAAIAPDFAPAYAAMGVVYMINGQSSLSREALTRALELDPGMKIAKSYLNQMARETP